jgi:hypothetical protein
VSLGAVVYTGLFLCWIGQVRRSVFRTDCIISAGK